MDADHRYRQLIDLAPDVVYHIDAESKTITSLNPAFAEVTGWHVDEWVGRPFAEILHPDDIELAVLMVQEVMAGRMSEPHLFRVRAKSGAYLTGEFRSAPWYEDGRVVGVFGIARDVTARVRAAEQQRFLANLSMQLSASLDYQSTVDAVAASAVPFLADWCLIYCRDADEAINRVAIAHANPSQAHVAERIRAEITVDSSAGHGVPEVIRSGRSLLASQATTEVLRGDVHQRDRLDEIVQQIAVTSWMCVPMSARGRVHGAISFMTAESEREYDEDDLALAEGIAYRAGLAIDNARLYTASQAALRDREAFLSTASHELKTPLTTVKGYVQMLQKCVGQDPLDVGRLGIYVGALLTQVRRIEAVVEDLLDVSRIREGRMALRPAWIDLVALVHQVVERFRASLPPDPHHVLHLDAPGRLVGHWDPNRIDQVLTNLVSNAVKYSPNGGAVRLTIRRIGQRAEVTVQDEGIGILASEQGHLFQPFGRSETVQRSISGVGLGLFISRQIVEQHGGSIDVDSDPGVGSTFRVRLPLETPFRDPASGLRVKTNADDEHQANANRHETR